MMAPIVFLVVSSEDASDEPLIIEAIMEGYLVCIIYADQRASVEVMFEHCFKNLSPKIRSQLRSTQTDLVGFAGDVVKPLGKLELEVVFKDGGLFRRVMMSFTIIRAPSPYNVILGRTGLQTLQAVSSTIHSMVKFPTPWGIATLGTPLAEAKPGEVSFTEEILINPSNMDVFVWEPSDMMRVPRKIIEHVLNANPSVEPFCQKRRMLAPDRSQVVIKEVEEWLKAGIVRPVKYPMRISNPVLVKKSQIRRSLKAYVDNMVIKSNDEKVLIDDIADTFDNLQKINMKLNPKKCSFRVKEGKFIGYMVTSKWIRANLKKTIAIADMQSLRTLKEIQSLSGKLAALNRFLARSAKRSLPFFDTLNNITN
ncbi:hypothetical protein Tco_1136413 [Tanacetum coccineum]